ncbi:MAG: SLBB domain-containing protein [Nitrospirae bacterium]|nr:SLBB domain-containing protein [Nitrospirota bacterium]
MRRLVLIIIASLFLFNLAFAAEPDSPTDSYRVGVNDILEVRVFDHPELSGQVLVGTDGTITLPHIGGVQVKGKRLSDITEEINRRLKESYIKYPMVSVSLVRSLKKIFVYGEVSGRGEILFEENMTVVKALSLAGGLNPNGIFGKVKIRRKQKGKGEYRDIEIDLKRVVEGNGEGDMLLQPDDILIVERNKKFYIQGAIIRPGEYPLEKDMTLAKAISTAGGIMENGLYGKVSVKRTEGTAYKDIAEVALNKGAIDADENGEMLLQSDDILIVERSKIFYIQGEVSRPGEYVLENGMTITKAIAVAGGVTQHGLYGKVIVKRKEKGELVYKNITEVSINKGVIDAARGGEELLHLDDIVIVERSKTFFVHGEVTSPGEYVLEKDMSVIKALSIAGRRSSDGLYGKVKVRRKQDEAVQGYKDIEIDIKGIIEKGVSSDILLQPNDIIIVGRNKTFFIYGEVNKPGEYVLQDDMTVFKAIAIAGGLTKWGAESRIKVIRSTGKETGSIKVNINDIIKGNTSKDIKLEYDDFIIVSSGVF